MKVAAIGIGSNSLRMLVAEVGSGQIEQPVRYRKGLRVFAALDDKRNISQEMIAHACESVLEFKREALEAGAQQIHLFATSAVRDAANQRLFAERLFKTTGLELNVCSGEEEASLSFLGACGHSATGMIDIGGGSTEIAVGNNGSIFDADSLQMGAVRLFRMMPIYSAADAEKVVAKACEMLSTVKERFCDTNSIYSWVGVGGTFTTCAAIVQRIPWQQREKIHHFVMTRKDVKAAMDYLAPLTTEERLALECLQPQRADIVVHGIAILLACMRELNIHSITVSEHGNLEGYLKMKYVFKSFN